MVPKSLEDLILWTDETKPFLEGVQSVVWGRYAASGPGQLAVIDGTPNPAVYRISRARAV